MYAKSVVDERLDIQAKLHGFKPELHSADEIDRFTDKLRQSEREDAQGRMYFARNLTHAEYRFIVNEKILCTCDAAYWLTRYAHVSDETNTNVRFRFRDTQKIYFDIISDLEERRLAIELLFGKARQQYVTTLTQLLAGHRVFFHQDTNAIDASADRVKSEEMARKIFFCYDNMPHWLKPKWSRRVEGVPGLFEFDSLSSRISIQHGSGQAKSKGGQRAGIGRGGGFTVYHISECSSIPKPEQQIDAAILKAVHASPKVFGVLESTFAGSTGWFADKYRAERERWPQGLARFCAIFFPWPCAKELYPTSTFLAAHPIPGDWKPEGKVLEQISKAELFIQNDPMLSKFFGRDWQMPRRQQWFYFVTYTEHEKAGALATLYQELPCDDVEAQISSFDSVFGHETIEMCHANRAPKYDVYAITGQSIEDSHAPDPDDIDTSKPVIPIIHTSNRGDIYKWELVPLKYELYEHPTGKREELQYINDLLFIYKHPSFQQPLANNAVTSRRYSVGIDTGSGQGYDYSAICVTEAGDGPVPDVQVAEWRSNTVGHVEAFAFAMPICLYFANPNKEVLSYPMVGIEQLTAVGDVCQKEMKRLGYPAGRFFNFGRYDGKRLKQTTNKQGWFTTGWSRPILVGNFIYVVKNQWYILNSPWTIEECREFEVHMTASHKVKEEHSSVTHDDSIFAAGISTFILHDMDTLADRSKNQSRVTAGMPQLILTPNVGFSLNVNAGGIKEATLDEILELSY